ncbi:MAG: response regulator [Acidobacteriaceae bacterium]|nr:response regulator [Acidobacteriaceae bacterium]
MAESAGSLLFVDDEAGIRITLPPVLQKAGFEVRVADSVSEALYEINSRQFDAVISDLNIGEEGDGFLVTSATRHVQPQCLTFILTGYPAFETALQAIHNRIDDYLVKPVDIEILTKVLKEKLHTRAPKVPWAAKRLALVLKSEVAQIVRAADVGGERGNGDGYHRELNRLFANFIEQLGSNENRVSADLARSAREYGKKQVQAGRTPSAVAADFRSLEQEAYNVVQKNVAGIDIPALISDLRKFSDGLHSLMEESLAAYGKDDKRAARKPAQPKRRGAG